MALPKNAKIGVMAPSSYVSREDIEKSAQTLTDQGFEVFIHPQTFEKDGQSAGSPLQKSLAFQGLWMRKDIDAIWCAGGGNQGLELLASINIDALNKSTPKPVLGFSDNTTLINAIAHHTKTPCYHAPVFKNLHTLPKGELTTLINIITGQENTLTFTPEQLTRPTESQQSIEGTLIGGNLSTFQYSASLLPEITQQDTFIFLEDCNEELSRIDRMFCYLKMLGTFKNAKAILLGQFSDLADTGRPFERTFDDIISAHLTDLNIPIIRNLPFGHTGPFTPLPVGKKAAFNTKNTYISWV